MSPGYARYDVSDFILSLFTPSGVWENGPEELYKRNSGGLLYPNNLVVCIRLTMLLASLIAISPPNLTGLTSLTDHVASCCSLTRGCVVSGHVWWHIGMCHRGLLSWLLCHLLVIPNPVRSELVSRAFQAPVFCHHLAWLHQTWSLKTYLKSHKAKLRLAVDPHNLVVCFCYKLLGSLVEILLLTSTHSLISGSKYSIGMPCSKWWVPSTSLWLSRWSRRVVRG